MEFNIFTGTTFLMFTGCLITLVVGVVYGRSMAKSQFLETLSQLKAEKLVLEEKLSNQE